MKDNFSRIGLAKLCGWFGITRQAYYQNSWVGIEVSIEEDLVLKEVLKVKNSHPAMGARKIHDILQPFLLDHQIKLGRDGLFDLLAAHRLLVKKRKRRIQTTWSSHWLRKYPNLIRGFEPTAPNQLWVSDITYWKIKGKNTYITFITDAYSHKIVGYHLAETMETIESIQALNMALRALGGPASHLIHHSDRGVQYCSSMYVCKSLARLSNSNIHDREWRSTRKCNCGKGKRYYQRRISQLLHHYFDKASPGNA